MGLMTPPQILYNMGNWTRIMCTKPNSTLTYRSQRKNKEHRMCKTITGNESHYRKNKMLFQIIEDRGTIKTPGEIFHLGPLQINLISVNHTLENLGQVKAHLEDETNKVKITLQGLKKNKNMHSLK